MNAPISFEVYRAMHERALRAEAECARWVARVKTLEARLREIEDVANGRRDTIPGMPVASKQTFRMTLDAVAAQADELHDRAFAKAKEVLDKAAELGLRTGDVEFVPTENPNVVVACTRGGPRPCSCGRPCIPGYLAFTCPGCLGVYTGSPVRGPSCDCAKCVARDREAAKGKAPR